MVLRATKQFVEILAPGSGDLRATRQYVEILAPGSGDLRITRQYVEVLSQAPIEKIVSQSLTINQVIGLIINRTGIPSQAVSNTLVFAQESGAYIDKLETSSSIEFEQTAEARTNNYRINQELVFVYQAYSTDVYEKSILDSLTFIQEPIGLSNSYRISQELVFEQYGDLNGYARQPLQEFTFEQSVSVDINTIAGYPENEIVFVQSVEIRQPYNLTVDNTFSFAYDVVVHFPFNLTIIMPMDWVYNSDGYPQYYSSSFQQEAKAETSLGRRLNRDMTLEQTVGVVVEKTTAISKTASNTLTFNQTANITYLGESAITFSQEAIANVVKAGHNNLELEQAVIFSHKRVCPINNELILKSLVSYNLITRSTLYQYSPFIGSSTDADVPSPPHILPRTLTKQDGIQLFYPLDNPTTTILLRGPELDDRTQLQFSRINRETRGGTLVIFSDPDWPSNQRLVLSFVGLTEETAQDVLILLEATVGQQIGLRDWENQEWAGVILSTQNPITRDGKSNLSINLEFEGVHVHRQESVDSLSLSQEVISETNYQRSKSDSLSLSQEAVYQLN